MKLRKFLGLIAVLFLSVVIFVFGNKFVNLQGYGYAGLFFLSILGNATIILPVPVVLTAFLGGGIFNPLWVGVVVSLGATIGELTGYLAGTSGREVIKSKKFLKIKTWMHQYGLWTIFALAAIPNPAFDLAGIVAGAAKIPVYQYIVIVFLGKLVKFLAISYLGSGIMRTSLDRAV